MEHERVLMKAAVRASARLGAADERHLLSAGEGLQCGPGLVDSVVARATERAANDVDEAPNPLTSDILGDCLNTRFENEASEERRDLGIGIAHISKFLMLVGPTTPASFDGNGAIYDPFLPCSPAWK
jgi:hypothetical protein